VIGLTQSLAKEVAARGIRVNAVCPGIVAGTEMRAQVDAESRALGRPTSADSRSRRTSPAWSPSSYPTTRAT
jgi:NAD(P)-dependent dehydrogenase (short-subunit alcohol dehydrogenase family)